MKWKYFLPFTVGLICFSISIRAQNKISGYIKAMGSGVPLQGVSVIIPDLNLGTVSDSTGFYSINNIPAGTWLLETGINGYCAKIEEITVKGSRSLNYLLAPSSKEMPEIVVTGVATAIQQRKNPVPVNIILQEDLLQNSSVTIIDAIAAVSPGVSVITDEPSITKPVIRGLSHNRVVVVNDGVRQEDQQWDSEFGIAIDEHTVNRVEILKGPASLSYGSDAMAGVINFLSANPLPEGKIKGSLLSNYQTNNGLLGFSANIAGNKDRFTWDLRLSKKMAHAYRNKYDGYVWNSGFGESDLKAIIGMNRKWGYTRLSVSSFKLKLGIVEGTRDPVTGEFTADYLTASGSDSLGIAPANGFTKYNYYPIVYQHVQHYKAVWDNQIIFGKANLKMKLGYQENYRQEANDITLGDVFVFYSFARTLNYDLQYLLNGRNKMNWSFGVNGMRQSSENRGTVFLVPEYKSFDIGVFSTVRRSFGKLTVSGGLRVDSRVFHGQDLYLDTSLKRVQHPDSTSLHRFAAYSSNFSGVSGSVGVAYDLTDNLYGKLNISRGYRAPTIAETGSDGIHEGTPFYEIGDPTLKPESSFQFDATIGLRSENFDAELNAFSNLVRNYIFLAKLAAVAGGDSVRTDPAASVSGPSYKFTSGDAVVSGGELTADLHPKKIGWLHFENSISLISAIQRNQGDLTRYLPHTPPTRIQSKLKFVFDKLSPVFQNAYVHVGIDANFKQEKVYYQYGTETAAPAYTLLKAAMGSDIFCKKRKLFSLFINANNITDVAYQTNMSLLKYTETNNATGRTGVFNMGRNFSVKLLVPLDF